MLRRMSAASIEATGMRPSPGRVVAANLAADLPNHHEHGYRLHAGSGLLMGD
jgi:hypothetical protein